MDEISALNGKIWKSKTALKRECRNAPYPLLLDESEKEDRRMKGKAASLFTAVLSLSLLAGCSGGEMIKDGRESDKPGTENVTNQGEVRKREDEELENLRNQDGIGKKELLAVSFGTSYEDSRKVTIGAIEDALEKAFPEYSVRRGFTSQIIIDLIKSRDQMEIDNVEQALDRAADNGVETLIIQPTHLMDGLEYHDLVEEAARYADAFSQIVVGEPLLSSEDDFRRVIQAITQSTAEYDDGKTAICFMGHGTEAESNQVYEKMQDMLSQEGYSNYFVGTVEASPSLEDVLEAVKEGEYEKAVLQPLMIVAGDHANNDMAGEEEGSWKRAFEDEGYQVTCVLKGLGELEEIQQIFVDHAQAAMDSAGE